MGDAAPPITPRVPQKDFQKVFHYTDTMTRKPTRGNDPYGYIPGFGNRHQSEVIPGTLPAGQNNPQAPRFGLYTEGITGSAFTAPRAANFSTYMYRVRPAAAHDGYKANIPHKGDLENCFLTPNPRVATLPSQGEWSPFPLPPSFEKIDFVDGLHTLAGSGDPNLREGLALYVYMFNTSMEKRAFCNTDGEFLIVPQLGNLDIQTEMGMLFLQPGEICVLPRGVRFKVCLGPGHEVARGYITEIWGSRWELPDLGPLGGHALANPRDFLHPVAYIDDIDALHASWTIVNKANGTLNAIAQDHSPFDLVAWHGSVVPYKYDLTKFSSQNATSIDHTDPSVNIVLTAPSRDPHTPLADFLWFGPRWDVASNTFRLPYFHRNAATEFLASLYGNGLGRSEDFAPGGGSVEVSHTPHGNFSREYVWESREQVNEPRRILENQMTIMIESSRSLLFTEYARSGCGVFKEQGTNPRVWDTLPDKFSAYPNIREILAQVKKDKEERKERLGVYYDDERLGELFRR
ncbi:RmlC-like cupin domain-containing protein [Aspergillus undulatus]|uniref:RmlC-like cupin domain-containing protein n=1 Tax=Aspergillus undulatus TaxID=1810928 RepID=UPI003CCD05B5